MLRGLVPPTTWGMFQPKGKLQQSIAKVFYTLNAWLSFSFQIVWLCISCAENTHSLWWSSMARHNLLCRKVWMFEIHSKFHTLNAMTFGVRGVNQFQLLRLISFINRGNDSEGKHQSRSDNTKLLCVEVCERKNSVE